MCQYTDTDTHAHTELNLLLIVIREKHAGQPQSPQAEQTDAFIEDLGSVKFRGWQVFGGKSRLTSTVETWLFW